MPIEVLMPALSPTMEEGTLATWVKSVGDTIAAGDVIAEIETDKATMELEAVEEGILARILIDAGTDNVAINTPIALILEEGEDQSAVDEYSAGSSAIKAAQSEAAPTQSSPTQSAPVTSTSPSTAREVSQPEVPEVPQATVTGSGSRLFVTPLARRLASQNNLDVLAIAGTGPHGRIIKRDVIAAAAMPQSAVNQNALPAPVAAGERGYDIIKLNSMRKTIARRMVESKSQVPHFYLSVDCEIDRLLDVRKQLNAQSPEGEGAYKISVNDFVIKAVARAMRAVPEANAAFMGDVIHRFTDVDIAVAVAIDGGLITPIMRDADQKGLTSISNDMKDLARRAREGKLAPEEYQGGGVSISNLGMFGIKNFSAILNPPQAIILAVGAGEQRPVVKNDELTIATVMNITVSVDHRSVDGAVGARFISAVKSALQDPFQFLL